MRAVAVMDFGGPDALQLVELPDPVPGPGQLRIRVKAAAVNPVDTVFRSGSAPPHEERPPPYVPGMDAAGEVDAVGAGVDREVGERVMAVVLPRGPHGGAYADHIVVPAEQVVPVPAGWTDVEASTLPMNGLTARMALDLLSLEPEQVLAVTGAAGAVGGYVVQLAKHVGLRVVADASPADVGRVSALGADVVVLRGPTVGERFRAVVPDGVDGLVDGAVIGPSLLTAVRDSGAVVTVRPFSGRSARGISVRQVRVADYARETEKLDELRRLAEAGVVWPQVAFTMPLDRAAEAHRLLEAGGIRGRIVLVTDYN